MTQMKTLFSCFILIICLAAFWPANALDDRIVAVVGDDVITKSELDNRLIMVIKSSNLPQSQEVISRFAPQVLNGLIDEKLQMQEAERFGLSVSDEELLRGIESIAQQNNMTTDQFGKVLQAQQIPASSFAKQVKAQIAWSKLVQNRIRPRIEISDSDIDVQIEKLKANAGATEYLLSEIFLPLPENKEEAVKIRDLARKIHQDLAAGRAEFAPVARQFSQGTGALQGGMLGWIGQDQLQENLRAAVVQAKAGALLPPIETELGYHILRINDMREVNFDPEETNMLVLRSELGQQIGQQRLETEARRYMRDLRAGAFIEYRV